MPSCDWRARLCVPAISRVLGNSSLKSVSLVLQQMELSLIDWGRAKLIGKELIAILLHVKCMAVIGGKRIVDIVSSIVILMVTHFIDR